MSDYRTPDPAKKLNLWLPFLFSLILVIGMLLGFKLQSGGNTASNSLIPMEGTPSKIEELIRFIELKYVDKVNRKELTERAINAILKDLDPHSNYIPAEELQAINEELDGKFEGVGIHFLVLDDTIHVISAISGGPSDLLGITAGDKIVQIEDSVVAGVGITSEGVVARLKGEKGTKVRIGILRGQQKKIMSYTITRDEIPIYSIDAAYMADKETGYVKINRFSDKTYQEFMEALEKLVNKGAKNLVIDLRQNPGGYLNAATKILDQLFDTRQLLVYTEGRSYARNNYKSTGHNLFQIKEVAVLIDEGSASASEILAGAIQDNDRGTIVGRRSFGKGLVQEQYDLSDGSALRLTVARYYTPSGRCIQKPYADREAYEQEMENRFEQGELVNQDKITLSDTTKYYTTNGRVVYGGGGIMPDVFVALDTLLTSATYAHLAQAVPKFVYAQIGNYKQKIEAFQSLEAFTKNYTIDDATFSAFLKHAQSEGVTYNEKAISKMLPELKLRLKAYFARQIFKDEGYFFVLNSQDPYLKAALNAIKKK